MKMVAALSLNGCHFSISSRSTLPPSNLTLPSPLPSKFPSFPFLLTNSVTLPSSRRTTGISASSISTGTVEEVLPPVLDSSSDPPPLFDGTTRLYIRYRCPYAQRVWIIRNFKGLQNLIQLVPINLQNRPAWYKEKVNPANKVPSLEHKNEIIVESLDLLKYIDGNFEGPSLSPTDPAKQKFSEEIISYSGSFNSAVASSFKEEIIKEETIAAFDYLETALGKFDDGPFLLGQFSLADIAYAPFIERFKVFFLDVKKYDIAGGRPRLIKWIEQMEKIDSYKRTQCDPKVYVEAMKRRYLGKI